MVDRSHRVVDRGILSHISNSGLFWAVRAAEKKNPNCHKYATFEDVFFMFSWAKKIFEGPL